MPSIKFTAKSVHHLQPTDKTVEYYEAGRRHGTGTFGIRVSKQGKKAWFLLYKNDAGKQKRLTLGTYPTLSLSAAREAADNVMLQKNRGDDPHTEKKRKQSAPTVIDLWEAYQDALSQRQKPKAANTVRQENSMWRRIIEPTIGHLKVEDVKPADLAEMLKDHAKTSPVSANRMHSLLSVMFQPALELNWITIHPLQWVKKPGGTEAPRKRILSDKEILRLWPHIEQLRRNPRDQLKLGLLTAQRPGEIATMRWSDIDLDQGIWKQADTKAGNLFLVPLSPQVIEIIQARQINPGRRYKSNPSDYVFPTAHNTPHGAKIKPAISPTKPCRLMAKELGLEHFTPHDLRRTARTLMSRLEIPHHIRERVLNHSQGKIEAVYDQFDYLREKRSALNKLANEIDRIVGKEKKAEKVIKLRAN